MLSIILTVSNCLGSIHIRSTKRYCAFQILSLDIVDNDDDEKWQKTCTIIFNTTLLFNSLKIIFHEVKRFPLKPFNIKNTIKCKHFLV